jgi:hypothetical protein
MQIDDFKSIVSTFADPGSEILFEKTKIIISVNGDLLDASLSTRAGDVQIDDGNGAQPASNWILTRLAKLPLLATRLRETVKDNETFVSPAATLLPSLEVRPENTVIQTTDALHTTLQALEERSPLETTVLYITSDAGEGKTSLINQLTREQASRFIANRSDWLLVPIALGGRHFLRFDDITVGALQNRYRFPFLYYNSFLALVKMGVIVPAFDGFEEMFIENSSGEALSAMGLLVGALDSKGALVIAARKAYFEFENLKTQEKLYDTISNYDVGFGKLELRRWARDQFIAYCRKREVANPDLIYDRVRERLGETHSLLTRPVLVRRLVDIACQSPSLEGFLEGIHASGPDFFSVFVRSIIEREANEKWIDRSGEVGSPLLTVDEHCELLSHVAVSMWEARLDYLKREHLEFVTDYFCETKRKNAFQTQQIKERIRGHALLVSSANAAQAVEFDHEEFRLFFLGEGIADQVRPLSDRAKGDVLASLRKGALPRHAQHAFIRAIKRDPKLSRLEAAKFLLGIASVDGQASYTQENCSGLIVRLLRECDGKGLRITGLAFGMDALRDRKLANIVFDACYFSPSSLEMTDLQDCEFTKCKFSQIRLYNSTTFKNTKFNDCAIDGLRIVDRELDVWEPDGIQMHLQRWGAQFGQEPTVSANITPLPESVDAELADVEKVIRHFMRSTRLSENVMLKKLGNRAPTFLNHTIPELLELHIMDEVENRGGGDQRHFKLGLPLRRINEAVLTAEGSYARFLKEFDTVKS